MRLLLLVLILLISCDRKDEAVYVYVIKPFEIEGYGKCKCLIPDPTIYPNGNPKMDTTCYTVSGELLNY